VQTAVSPTFSLDAVDGFGSLQLCSDSICLISYLDDVLGFPLAFCFSRPVVARTSVHALRIAKSDAAIVFELGFLIA
jgi:hypothetical protein